MTDKTLQVSDEIAFHTSGLEAVILVDGEEYVTLGRDDLGAISEWLAEAWVNVAGEPYTHTEYDQGLVAIVKEGAPLADPSFLHLMSDPGPHGESYGRDHTLERDCE